MKLKRLSFYIILLLSVKGVYAQDLGNLKNQKPFSVRGSISMGTNFYASNEKYESRDPFSWNLYGNLTPTIYGIAFPLSFVVNQYSKSYSAPFSMYGMSPSYKWATLHLGYRSMSFSPLVYSGQTFLGAGVELRPRGFQFSAFYGRLNKAISEDMTPDHRVEPQYSRLGYGLKIGFGSGERNLSIQYFHARDLANSIEQIQDTLNRLQPQENTVLGGTWRYTFFKKLTISGDAAASLLNHNVNYRNLDSIGHYRLPGIVRSLAPVNKSTVFSYSGAIQAAVSLKMVNLSVNYQRIQPDFKSLGVPYALNDIELLSGTVSTNLLKGKININTSLSSQHNNLEHMLSSELVARSGNMSVNALINQHLNLNFNLNGSQVLQRDGFIKLSDSAKMDQLMLNYSLSPSYNISGSLFQHSISANLNYTDLNDHNPLTRDYTNGNNFNAAVNYALTFLKSYKGINTGLSYSVYGQGDNKYESAGINAGVNAQFLKNHNLNAQGNVGYFINKSALGQSANNITFSLSGGYALKKHALSLYSSFIITPPVNLNPLDKISYVPYAVNTKNFAGGISYSYQF